MTLTDRIYLSSLDICAIIEACAANQVTKLKYGDLYVELGRHTPQKKILPLVPNEPKDEADQTSDKEISDINHDEINKETLELDAMRLREEMIEELFVTDPLQAEEMLRNGELEDDIDESGDDE